MKGDIFAILLCLPCWHPTTFMNFSFQNFLNNPPATICWGSHLGRSPINGAWASDNITVNAISWHDIPSSPGDHCAIVLDLNLVDCIGEPWYSVRWPPGCHLNCSLPSALSKYLELFEHFSATHKLSQQLNKLFLLACHPATSQHTILMVLKTFDKLKLDGMKYAEKGCCRFHAGLVQFSLDSIYGANAVNSGSWLSGISKGLISKLIIFVDSHTSATLITLWLHQKMKHWLCYNKLPRTITILNHNTNCFVLNSYNFVFRINCSLRNTIKQSLGSLTGILTGLLLSHLSALQLSGRLQDCCGGISHSFWHLH